jgi:hypothetical protein
MYTFEILHHPLDEVVFEHPLDDLMKEIWGDQFMDVCAGEMFSERLEDDRVRNCRANRSKTYNDIGNDAIIFPYALGVIGGLACVGMLLGPQYGVGHVKMTRR